MPVVVKVTTLEVGDVVRNMSEDTAYVASMLGYLLMISPNGYQCRNSCAGHPFHTPEYCTYVEEGGGD